MTTGVQQSSLPSPPTDVALARLAWRVLLNVSVGASMCGILAGCSAVPIQPPYTQEQLKSLCERRSGRWHGGEPMRSFCEYDSRT